MPRELWNFEKLRVFEVQYGMKICEWAYGETEALEKVQKGFYEMLPEAKENISF